MLASIFSNQAYDYPATRAAAVCVLTLNMTANIVYASFHHNRTPLYRLSGVAWETFTSPLQL